MRGGDDEHDRVPGKHAPVAVEQEQVEEIEAGAGVGFDGFERARGQQRVMIEIERSYRVAFIPDETGEARDRARAGGSESGEFGGGVKRRGGEADHPPLTGGRKATSLFGNSAASSPTNVSPIAARTVAGSSWSARPGAMLGSHSRSAPMVAISLGKSSARGSRHAASPSRP